MSFYAPRRHMGQFGIIPLLMAVAPVVQGMMQSHPLDLRDPYAQLELQQQSNPLVTVALAAGGLALIGGVFFILVKK